MAKPQMARAWRYNRRGLPRDVLTLDSIPIPALPPPNIRNNSAYLQQPWVLVKVSHVSLNPGCTTVMSAIPAFVRARTAIAEAEFAGTVQRVWTPESPAADDADVDAPSSSKFQIGDAVFGMIPSGLGFAGVGALATHVAMPEELVLRRPEGVAPEYACGMSFTGLTALQMAVDAKLKEGDRVLVNAASGGVGTMAVQLVRNIVGTDGVVVGICSGKNAEMVRGLGADEVFDYTEHDSVAVELAKRYAAQPFDAILDCIGTPELYNSCAPYLKEKGVYSTVGVRLPSWSMCGLVQALSKLILNELWPTSTRLGGAGREWKMVQMMASTREVKEKLALLVQDGTMKVVIDSVWDFEDPFPGYDIVGKGRARGKVVVRIDA